MRGRLMNSTSFGVGGIGIMRSMEDMGGGGQGGGGIKPPAGGGQTGNTGDNYSQGNDDGKTNNGTNQDYGGVGVDPARFWDTPAEETGGEKPKEGDQSGTQPPKNESQQQGERFVQMIDSLQFEPVFTPEIVEQLGQGDITGANAAIMKQQQAAVRESIKIMAQVTQAHTQQVMREVDRMIKDSLTQTNSSRDNEALLAKEIPAFTRPETKVVVQRVFDQSLLHSKGDREKAVNMTKAMLKAMGQAGGEDFGTPPPSPDDTGSNHPGVGSLVESLLSRG